MQTYTLIPYAHIREEKYSQSEHCVSGQSLKWDLGREYNHNKVPGFTPASSYSTQSHSLLLPDMIQGPYQMCETLSKSRQGCVINHTFITALHSLLSCTIILPCSDIPLSFKTLSQCEIITNLNLSFPMMSGECSPVTVRPILHWEQARAGCFSSKYT